MGLWNTLLPIRANLEAFPMVRLRLRNAPVGAEKEEFVGAPQTAPTVFALDPRGDDPAPQSR